MGLVWSPDAADAFRLRLWASLPHAGSCLAHTLSPHPSQLGVVMSIRTSETAVNPGRRLLNAPEVFALLRGAGLGNVTATDLGVLPFAEQARIMSCAKLLLAARGAAIMNALFMPRGGVVIELAPAIHFHEEYSDMVKQNGHVFIRHMARMDESIAEDKQVAAWFEANGGVGAFTALECMLRRVDCWVYSHRLDYHADIALLRRQLLDVAQMTTYPTNFKPHAFAF